MTSERRWRLAAEAERLNVPVKILGGIPRSPSGNGEMMAFPLRRGFSKAPLIAAGLFILVLTILPGHAIARCFGVPEGLGDEPGVNAWFMRLRIEAATGLVEQVTFGFHPDATDGFDSDYDQFARPFDLRPGGEGSDLVAYFSYPENYPESGGIDDNEPTPSRLRISTIQPRLDMAWPLRIVYLFPQDTRIELRWNTSEALDLEGFDVNLHTPSDEWLSLGVESSYAFNASLGIHRFLIDAHGTPGSLPDVETPAADTLVLVGSFAAYGAVIAIILGLRWMRKRRT